MRSLNRTGFLHTLKIVQSVQAFFPPGLAGDAVAMASEGKLFDGGCIFVWSGLVCGGRRSAC